MKIKPETLRQLQSAIDADGGITPEATMRQRWDALWRACDSGRFDYSALKDLSDAHIDTALRTLAKK